MAKKKVFYEICIFVFLSVLGAFIAYSQGKDGSWDLANYHYYGVHAFLKGRIGFDIMPGGIISYMNPILDIPLYFSIKYLNSYPVLISCLTGMLWGVTTFLLYKFSSIIYTKKNCGFFVIVSTVIGSTGVLSFFSCGISYNDLPICIIGLAALFILFKNLWTQDSRRRNLWILLSGILLGAATGLKYVGIYFLIGILGALIISVVFEELHKPFKIFLFFILGYIIGFSVTGLWWAVFLYDKFGNPFFPKLNNIFQSSLALPVNYADNRHFGDRNSLMELIFFPFYSSWARTFESFFVDFRYRFLCISCLFLLSVAIFSKFKPECINKVGIFVDTKKLFFLNYMLFSTYIIWFNTTSYLRYIIFYELVSGLLIIGALLIAFQKFKFFLKKELILILCIFLAATTKYCDVNGYRVPFADKYLNAPDLNIPDDSIVLELGGWPACFFIPFNNHNVRWIYIFGEACDFNFKYPQEQEERIKKIIDEHKDKTYLIYSETDFAFVDWDYVSKFINKDDFICEEIGQNSFAIVEKYKFCSMKKNVNLNT